VGVGADDPALVGQFGEPDSAAPGEWVAASYDAFHGVVEHVDRLDARVGGFFDATPVVVPQQADFDPAVDAARPAPSTVDGKQPVESEAHGLDVPGLLAGLGLGPRGEDEVHGPPRVAHRGRATEVERVPTPVPTVKGRDVHAQRAAGARRPHGSNTLDVAEGLALQLALEHEPALLSAQPPRLAHPRGAEHLDELIRPRGREVGDPLHAPPQRDAGEHRLTGVEACLQRNAERGSEADRVDARGDRLGHVVGHHDAPRSRAGSHGRGGVRRPAAGALVDQVRDEAPARPAVPVGDQQRRPAGPRSGGETEPVRGSCPEHGQRDLPRRVARIAATWSGTPVASKTHGTVISTTLGSFPQGRPSESNRRDEGLAPRSTVVAMCSRPWIPSPVGRTISDIMPSHPGPPKGPR